jgi:hypothetical protein
MQSGFLLQSSKQSKQSTNQLSKTTTTHDTHLLTSNTADPNPTPPQTIPTSPSPTDHLPTSISTTHHAFPDKSISPPSLNPTPTSPPPASVRLSHDVSTSDRLLSSISTPTFLPTISQPSPTPIVNKPITTCLANTKPLAQAMRPGFLLSSSKSSKQSTIQPSKSTTTHDLSSPSYHLSTSTALFNVAVPNPTSTKPIPTSASPIIPLPASMSTIHQVISDQPSLSTPQRTFPPRFIPSSPTPSITIATTSTTDPTTPAVSKQIPTLPETQDDDTQLTPDQIDQIVNSLLNPTNVCLSDPFNRQFHIDTVYGTDPGSMYDEFSRKTLLLAHQLGLEQVGQLLPDYFHGFTKDHLHDLLHRLHDVSFISSRDPLNWCPQCQLEKLIPTINESMPQTINNQPFYQSRLELISDVIFHPDRFAASLPESCMDDNASHVYCHQSYATLLFDEWCPWCHPDRLVPYQDKTLINQSNTKETIHPKQSRIITQDPQFVISFPRFRQIHHLFQIITHRKQLLQRDPSSTAKAKQPVPVYVRPKFAQFNNKHLFCIKAYSKSKRHRQCQFSTRNLISPKPRINLPVLSRLSRNAIHSSSSTKSNQLLDPVTPRLANINNISQVSTFQSSTESTFILHPFSHLPTKPQLNYHDDLICQAQPSVSQSTVSQPISTKGFQIYIDLCMFIAVCQIQSFISILFLKSTTVRSKNPKFSARDTNILLLLCLLFLNFDKFPRSCFKPKFRIKVYLSPKPRTNLPVSDPVLFNRLNRKLSYHSTGFNCYYKFYPP